MWDEESCGSFCDYALIFGFGRLWRILKDRNSKWKARTCTDLSRRLLLARYDQILCDFGWWYAGVEEWFPWFLSMKEYISYCKTNISQKTISLRVVYFVNNIPPREEHYMSVFCIFHPKKDVNSKLVWL